MHAFSTKHVIAMLLENKVTFRNAHSLPSNTSLSKTLLFFPHLKKITAHQTAIPFPSVCPFMYLSNPVPYRRIQTKWYP